MKWPFLFLVTGVVTLSPNTTVYRLKVMAPSNILHDRYLSTDPSGIIGIFGLDSNEAPRFSVTTSADKTNATLHASPALIVDHVLAIVGEAGLQTLREVVPAVDPQEPTDWTSFTLATPGNGSALTLSYSGSPGGWLAMQRAQDAYSVAWYDNTSFLLQTYRRIRIACEAVPE